VKPNMSTMAPPQTDAEALQRADAVCAALVKAVMDWQRERGTEGEGSADVGQTNEQDNDGKVKVPLGGWTIGGLQRLRREFVALLRVNPGAGRGGDLGIRSEFVRFVNQR